MPSKTKRSHNPTSVSTLLDGYAGAIASHVQFMADNEDHPCVDLLHHQLSVLEDMAADFIVTMSDDNKIANLHIIASSLSKRLLDLCPTAGANRNWVHNNSIENLGYWLEPGILTLLHRTGVFVRNSYPELVWHVSQAEGVEDELVGLAISGWFDKHSSALLSRKELYNLRSTENLTALFKHIVSVAPDEASETLTEALNHHEHQLAVALYQCGVEPQQNGLRKKLGPRSTDIFEKSKSTHGKIALVEYYGDIETQMQKLQAMYKDQVGHI